MKISDPLTRIIITISKGSSWLWEINNPKDEFTRAVLTVSVAVLLIAWYAAVITNRNKKRIGLPPGPRRLPIIGNLPFLEPDLHRYFAKLAKTYGPIISLQLGQKLYVVVSSSSLAKEILKDQDTTFANRDVPVAARAITYGGQDIGWSQYGPHWRMLRKVCMGEVLNGASLDAFGALRRREVRQMVRTVYSKVGTPVPFGEMMFETIFNTITSMIWGGSHKGDKGKSISAEFRQVVTEAVEILSKPNISDLFPVLAPFDLQGLVRKTKKLSLWLDRIFDRAIDQRLEMDRTEEGKANKDFLQLLLQVKEKGDPKMPLTTDHIKALLTDFVSAGNDTTSTTIEWTMAKMIQQPETIRRAQEELDQVVGKNAVVEETHLPKLHYLSAVVKEVMRLYPVSPLLLPHSPSQSCVVGGYLVPKGAQVFVNAWAIQRDPEVWDNPLEFQPERFLTATNKFDYNGNDLCYIPFGSGRRVCVGMVLAERLVMYTLASLLHSFDWQLPEGTKVNLSDKFGIILRMATPLVAIPTARLTNSELFI